MKIKLKMTLAFLVIASLGVAGGYLSVVSSEDISDEVIQRTSSINEVRGINEVKVALYANQAALQVLMERHWAEIGEGAPGELGEVAHSELGEGMHNELGEEIEAAEARIFSSFDEIEQDLLLTRESTLAGLEIATAAGNRDEISEEQQQLLILDKLEAEMDIYEAYSLQFLELSDRDLKAAGELLESKLEPNFNEKILPLVEEFESHAEKKLILGTNRIQRTIDRTNVVTAGVTLTAVGVAAGFGLLISQLISRPITRLSRAATEIAGGNFDSEIKPTTGDEIGELARCFDGMRQSILRTNQNLNKLVLERTKELEKANEELRRKDRLKDEFISIASHELKNPIQPILGFAQLAKQGKIDEKEAWDIVYEHARRLQRLAYDIIDVSKIESGDLQYFMEKVPINDIILKVVDDSRLSLDGQVSIESKLDKNVQIEADKDRITQVLTNIISNAIKFTKKGKIKVESRLHPKEDEVEIVISDTGPGIPEDILPQIFGKFATKTTGDYHGAGLGLFISKAIIEAHGGRISAQNNEVTGATFMINLPIKGRALIERGAEAPMTS